LYYVIIKERLKFKTCTIQECFIIGTTGVLIRDFLQLNALNYTKKWAKTSLFCRFQGLFWRFLDRKTTKTSLFESFL
jgi:hypothetical protein